MSYTVFPSELTHTNPRKPNYVSLHGLRTLFGLHKKLAGQGGDVKVAAVRGTIAGMVAESRLSDLFQVYPYVDRARTAFGERPAGHLKRRANWPKRVLGSAEPRGICGRGDSTSIITECVIFPPPRA